MFNFEIGKRYTFSTYSPGILGDYVDVVATSESISYPIANKLKGSVDTTHAQVYSELPKGVPQSASELTYVSFTTPTGDEIALATSWIIPNSVQISENRTMVVSILNQGQGSIDHVRGILAEYGYSVGEVRII